MFMPLVSWGFLAFFAIVWLTLSITAFVHGPAAAVRSKGRRVVPLVRRLLLGALLAGMLAGPALPLEDKELSTNVEIFLVVDRTGSMGAEDWGDNQPRFDGVRQDIEALLTATAGSRYSVITWDSAARVELPITTDASAVASFAELLHQEVSDYSGGSSMNRPVSVLLAELESAATERPENARFVVVFTDGESTDEGDPDVDAALWGPVSELADGGAVFGYGTGEGGPMLEYAPATGMTGEYIPDPDSPGQPALSHIDEQALAELAEVLDVPLLINPTVPEVDDIGTQIVEDAEQIDDGRRIQSGYRYYVWPFAIAAALLVIWELAALTAAATQLRRTNAI